MPQGAKDSTEAKKTEINGNPHCYKKYPFPFQFNHLQVLGREVSGFVRQTTPTLIPKNNICSGEAHLGPNQMVMVPYG